LIDELAVTGANDDCPQDSLDLQPNSHRIVVAIQGGNAKMHHEVLMKIAHFTVNEQVRVGLQRRMQIPRTQRRHFALSSNVK